MCKRRRQRSRDAARNKVVLANRDSSTHHAKRGSREAARQQTRGVEECDKEAADKYAAEYNEKRSSSTQQKQHAMKAKAAADHRRPDPKYIFSSQVLLKRKVGRLEV